MGQVTMDLNELDKIREDLKKQTSLVAEKDLVIKEKDEEIVKVKADKRTVKVVEKLQPKVKPQIEYDFRYSSPNQPSLHRLAYELYRTIKGQIIGRYEKGEGWMIQKVEVLLERLFKDHFTDKFSFDSMETVTTTEYINFDDVISEIQQKLEAKLASEIDGYKRKISALSDTVTNASISEQKKIASLTESYEEKLEILKKTSDEDFRKLQEDFDNFRLEKDTRSLEQQIKDLKAELEYERSRKWYQKRKKTK